jgi:RNA polymerase-binding transcription factor
VNTKEYTRRLLAEEEGLQARMARAGAEVREPATEVQDAGDASLDDVRKDEEFAAADAEWATLGQVREALRRLEDGTFGRCVVGGEPIEEERLRALPWTPVCARHARIRDAAVAARTPSL